METQEPYDSRRDTLDHIEMVSGVLNKFCTMMFDRANCHDQSKLEEPEKSGFDEFTPKLRAMTYGSTEYQQSLKDLQPILAHHYAANRHHPEHFDDGISGMNLIDLNEMFADWYSAVKRHADGDIMKSIEINRKRFNIDEQLVRIFQNTAAMLEQEGK